jgi:hypothetical protein
MHFWAAKGEVAFKLGTHMLMLRFAYHRAQPETTHCLIELTIGLIQLESTTPINNFRYHIDNVRKHLLAEHKKRPNSHNRNKDPDDNVKDI